MYSLVIDERIDNIEELDGRIRPLYEEFAGLSHSDVEGLVAWFTSEPTNLQAFQQQVAAQANADSIKRTVQGAIQFGQNLIIQFASENVLMGITQAGKTKLIADTLKDVSYYLNSGSLYEADNAASLVQITEEMSPFLTPARITTFRNKIRAYLGLPLL